MRLQPPPALVRALASFRRETGRLRAHRFWLECGSVAAASLIAAGLVGRASLSRAAELEREAVRLEQVRVGMEEWLRRVQPPAPAESLAWRASESQLAALGASDRDPLSLAGQITRRAEEVGVYDVGVGLANADSVQPPPPAATAGWTLEAGAPALEVGFAGDWGSILSFLGALPPEVQVGSVEVGRADEALRVRAVLFSRQATPVR